MTNAAQCTHKVTSRNLQKITPATQLSSSSVHCSEDPSLSRHDWCTFPYIVNASPDCDPSLPLVDTATSEAAASKTTAASTETAAASTETTAAPSTETTAEATTAAEALLVGDSICVGELLAAEDAVAAEVAGTSAVVTEGIAACGALRGREVVTLTLFLALCIIGLFFVWAMMFRFHTILLTF